MRKGELVMIHANHADKPAPLVVIVMGSKSDYEVMKESAGVLKEFEVPYEVRVISAHRTPDNALAFATGRKIKASS
jgi:phosphoribosylcarboxyaminoimidazole (NCAIR) mutase